MSAENNNNAKTVTLVVATDWDGGIGYKGKIPFNSDLAFFRDLTLGGTVIMGRKTWESLPHKPLEHRENIIVSRRKYIHNPYQAHKDTWYTNSVEDAIERANRPNVFIIGGGEIYKYALDNYLVDKVVLTKFNEQYRCDTHFYISRNWVIDKDSDYCAGFCRYFYRKATNRELLDMSGISLTLREQECKKELEHRLNKCGFLDATPN